MVRLPAVPGDRIAAEASSRFRRSLPSPPSHRILVVDDVVPSAVLVALTGYGQEEDRRQAFEAGFDHHLVKPTSVEALHELLLTVPSAP